MDFVDLPLGFGMALSRNPNALNTYSAMTREQKQSVLAQACGAGTPQEMNRLVESLAAR